MELSELSPNWAGCVVRGETLILDNDEVYTLNELRCLRWERNSWRRLANSLQRELKESGMEGAVVFEMDEIITIRKILALLDSKLPGNHIHQLRRA